LARRTLKAPQLPWRDMSALEFTVNTAELFGHTFVVTASGEADMHTAPSLDQALAGTVALGGTSVVLDLADVSFIDSTVLAVLLCYHRRFEDLGGELVLVSEDRRILRTLEITGLDRVFRLERKLAAGIGAVRAG
jgi:anti-sigma B factor antagonist